MLYIMTWEVQINTLLITEHYKKDGEVLQKLFFHILIQLYGIHTYCIINLVENESSFLQTFCYWKNYGILSFRENETKTRQVQQHYESTLRLTEHHFLDYIPATAKKDNPTCQCANMQLIHDMNSKIICHESQFHCLDCDVVLWVVPCFFLYQTVANT